MVSPQVAYAVVGHHTRRTEAKALASALDAFISMDDGSLGSLRNHDQAWRLALDQGTDWCVVLEDDALPVDNFVTHVADSVTNVPERTAISFYTGTTRPCQEQVLAALLNAELRHCAWLKANTVLWGPGLALPAEHVEPMLSYVASIDDIYDRRLGRYLESVNLPCYYTAPSLVDHRDGRSLLSRNDQPRRAHSVGVPRWNQRVSTI